MTRIYHLKRIPLIIQKWMSEYRSKHSDKICTFDIYKYGGIYYGANIFWDSKFVDNANQGTLEQFKNGQSDMIENNRGIGE